MASKVSKFLDMFKRSSDHPEANGHADRGPGRRGRARLVDVAQAAQAQLLGDGPAQHVNGFVVVAPAGPAGLATLVEPVVMLDESTVVSPQEATLLSAEFPPRVRTLSWKLIFCSEDDGYTLSTIYRKMAALPDLHTLLIIRDTNDYCFGALSSHKLRIGREQEFYGTGESFLFRLRPDFRVWKWTGANEFYVHGTARSLNFGADNGRFGLSLDDDLNHGRSQRCATFGNDPLHPDGDGDFTARTVEVWIFV